MQRDRQSRFSAKTLQALTATGLPQTFAVRAATAEAPAEILLYEEIGFWGVTARDFVSALNSLGAGPVRVRINSPGGDVFDGLAIYNSLRSHPGGVTCQVDGLAASAASFIAMAGGKCEMASSSMMMIHNAWGLVIGNKADMTQAAGTMAKIDGQLADIYAGKCGKPRDEIAAAMDAETWFTADEAVTFGLADGTFAAGNTKAATQGARTRASVAMRAALRTAIESGDPDLPGTMAALLEAQDSLNDAVRCLSGCPMEDDAAGGMADAMARKKFALNLKIAMAE